MLLTPLPPQQHKVVKENLLKTPALYFQISAFWYAGKQILLSVKQREGNKCLQEEDGCNVVKEYEVYYQDTMQLKGIGGNIPWQHIFSISPDAGLHPVIKLVLIIFGGRSSRCFVVLG